MTEFPQSRQNPPRSKGKGCLSCVLILGVSVVCMAGVLLLTPLVLQRLGVFGRQAKDVYQLAPDPVASRQLSQAFADRDIAGVSVYVIPIMGEETQGAFIILDESNGYTGISPMDDSDEVFIDLLRDLTERNRKENLRISHLTVDYRDEQGNSLLSFTVDQDTVEQYANGLISQEEFFRVVHFDLVKTLRRMGVEELLEEVQP